MKRILILPRKTTGIVDVRNEDYFILNNVNYLEQISTTLKGKGKNPNDYKFCQFDAQATIPYFMSIKDKLTNGFAEFETESIKFKDVPSTEEIKKQMIEQRHLDPVYQNLNQIKTNIMDAIIQEWQGEEIQELRKNELIEKKSKIEKTIMEFDYQKYLNEIV